MAGESKSAIYAAIAANLAIAATKFTAAAFTGDDLRRRTLTRGLRQRRPPTAGIEAKPESRRRGPSFRLRQETLLLDLVVAILIFAVVTLVGNGQLQLRFGSKLPL